MKKCAFIFCMLFIITCISYGQDKQSDLKKLFKLMHSEKIFEEVFDNMLPIFQQQASTQIQGDDKAEKDKEFMEFMMDEIKVLTSKLINEDMLEIYNKHFTHEEIKDLITFYESPTGKKMVEKTPEITKDTMELMMSKLMPAFQKRIAEKIEKLKK